ncbi:MAG: GGDEF domain-containing protein [Firmicutes bacterium]|nr:GGDEF domain-containing protein [Bacillota bacterium]
MEENKTAQVKGIRMRTLNLVLILASCVLYILVIYATVHAAMEYKAMVTDTDNYIECEKNAALVSDGSDYLTQQVQLYIVTRQPQYVERYFEEVYTTQRREKALKHMKQYPASEAACDYLENALENSNRLMEREIYAMKLVAIAEGHDMADFPQDVRSVQLTDGDKNLSRAAMLEKATGMVFGDYYQGAKAAISGNITYFLDSIVSETRNAQHSSATDLNHILIQQRIFISALFILSIAGFLLIRLLIVKPLKLYIDRIREGKALEVTGAYEFKYLAMTYNNIYEMNSANQELLLYKTQKDPLTGLVNRESFDYLANHMDGMSNQIALLIIDIDKFESINEEYGSETGEAVLKKAARLIEKSFRTTDFPARIGRDEFAVILVDVMPGLKSVIRNKVNAMNKLLQESADGLPPVSISAGGAFSQKGFTMDLCKSAEKALDYVKDHGRCGCSFFGENE